MVQEFFFSIVILYPYTYWIIIPILIYFQIKQYSENRRDKQFPNLHLIDSNFLFLPQTSWVPTTLENIVLDFDIRLKEKQSLFSKSSECIYLIINIY